MPVVELPPMDSIFDYPDVPRRKVPMNTPGEVPSDAYGFHAHQLEAWEADQGKHPPFVTVQLVRGEFGIFDGYLRPDDTRASAYILGWLNGRFPTAAK